MSNNNNVRSDSVSAIGILYSAEELLDLILAPFSYSVESLFVSLVCHRFNRIVKKQQQANRSQVVGYYARNGSDDALKLTKQIVGDAKFFGEFFKHARKELIDREWTLMSTNPTPESVKQAAILGAAFQGRLDLLTHHTVNQTFGFSLCEYAIQGNQLPVLNWAKTLPQWPVWSERICDRAAFLGSIESLAWAIENDCDWDKKMTWGHAIQGGHIPVLKWLIEQNRGGSRTVCMQMAVQSGHLHILKWGAKEWNSEWKLENKERRIHIEWYTMAKGSKNQQIRKWIEEEIDKM